MRESLSADVRSQMCPEGVRSPLDHRSSQALAPVTVVAMLRTPRPQALRGSSQCVFAREANCSMDLVRYRGGHSDGLVCPQLRCRYFKRNIACAGSDGCRTAGACRGRGLSAEQRELLLHGLELADRSAELFSFQCVADGEFER